MTTTARDSWSNDDLKTSAILRIADATEIMAKNYVQLQKDLDYYKNAYRNQQAETEKLRKQIATYKGHLTRHKNKTS